ncbi:MAG: hypothetical protein HKP43_03925 [Altererythrobacter sp.]|nr:pilus assembly protein [Altererythrobacter sp.]NNE49467.1 hypothetical protein [Altererythrobacter sp.]NNF94532.1 hypothetical protein [Altererythrobacter sp.]NNK45760.1 hypothetical protein [Altererythrobacter sp.]
MTKSVLKSLLACNGGSVAIETAFIVPILATMVLGGLEVSNIVSRQAELQTAAAEAAAVALARAPNEASERQMLESIIVSSTGLAADKVSMVLRYRCDTELTLETNASSCSSAAVVSEFIIIRMKDTYTPAWTHFGIGGPVDFNVSRRVQIS